MPSTAPVPPGTGSGAAPGSHRRTFLNASGAQMAVKYDSTTATMTASYSGANPQISYMTTHGTELAAIHLGVNSEPILRNNLTDPYLAAAIILNASMIVDGPSVA